MGALRPRLPAVVACAIVLAMVFSGFLAWTYATDVAGRLDHDFAHVTFLDIDGDGLTDAYRQGPDPDMEGAHSPGTLTFLQNSGGGRLEETGTWKAPGEITEVLAGDLDRDRTMEFLVHVEYPDSYAASTFLVTVKGWHVRASERPIQVLGFCNLSGDGRMQVVAGNSIWELVNGSLDIIPADIPFNPRDVADFDHDGRDEAFYVEWSQESDRLVLMSYSGGRLAVSASLGVKRDYDDHSSFASVGPSDSIVLTDNGYLLDRPAILVNHTDISYQELNSVLPGLDGASTGFQARGRVVFWSNESGGLVAGNATVVGLPETPEDRTAARADVNGDGFPDYLDAADRRWALAAYVSRLESGRLRYETQVLPLEGESIIHLEDLNGDRWPDIAALDFGDHRIKVYMNDGAGRFTRVQSFPFPYESATNGVESGWSLHFSDLDGDGRADLVAVNRDPTGGFNVYLNDGTGRLRQAGAYDWGQYPFNANDLFDVEHDVNGDGRPDIAYGYQTYPSGKAVVLLNDGRGRFPDDRAMPGSMLIALGTAAALALAFPVFRGDRPRWAGLPQAFRLKARARIWPAVLAVIILFLFWLAAAARLDSAWQGLGLFVLFVGVLPALPVAAAAGRPSKARFAGALLGSSWTFLAVSLAAGILLQPGLAAPAFPDRMIIAGIVCSMIVAVFAVLSLMGVRRMKAMEAGNWPSRPVPAELVLYLDWHAPRRFPISASARPGLPSRGRPAGPPHRNQGRRFPGDALDR
jgi:hypothetical protein